MNVIYFNEREVRHNRPQSLDWSNQEIADFYYAQKVLRQQGVCVGIDRGVTDIGEPWLVLFDNDSQEVLAHIARIDGVCVIVSDALNLKVEAQSVDKLILAFEKAIRLLVEDRAGAHSNVTLHPTARLVLSLAVLILLLKLDGASTAMAQEEQAQAEAGGLPAAQPVDDALPQEEAAPLLAAATELSLARRADILQRAQAFLARAADQAGADAPAILAGSAQLMLLAVLSDLQGGAAARGVIQSEDAKASLVLSEVGESDDETGSTATQPRGQLEHAIANSQVGSQDTVDGDYQSAATNVRDAPQVELEIALTSKVGALIYDSVSPLLGARATLSDEASREHAPGVLARHDSSAKQASHEAAPEPEGSDAASPPSPRGVSSESIESNAPTNYVTVALSSGDPLIHFDNNRFESTGAPKIALTGVIDTSLALQLSSSLDLNLLPVTARLEQRPLTTNPLASESGLVGNVQNDDATLTWKGVSPLADFFATVGSVHSTVADSKGMSLILSNAMSAFGKLDVEMSGGNVVLEQKGAESVDPATLGVWINTFFDNSQIIIIGQSAVMDDLIGLSA